MKGKLNTYTLTILPYEYINRTTNTPIDIIIRTCIGFNILKTRADNMTTEPIEITDFTIHARGTPGHTACGMELQRAVLLCWRAKEVTCEACLKKLGEVETDIVKKHVSIQRNIRLRDMLADFLPSIATEKINND